MLEDENKARIRRHFDEVLNGESREAAAELMLPERIDRLFDTLAMARLSRPDVRRQIEDMVAEGDRVAVRWSAVGTHTGEWTHPVVGRIAPTGKRVTNTAITIFRLAEGRIGEAWEVSNMLGLLQQMGAIPTPGGGN